MTQEQKTINELRRILRLFISRIHAAPRCPKSVKELADAATVLGIAEDK